MDVEELTQQIRSLPRERFIADGPSYYLLVTTRVSATDFEAGFNTLVPELKGKRLSSATRAMGVLPVAKAPGNPWPERISVGRARNCDVAIRDPSVSKLHAHFQVRPDGGLELVDVESQNGTCRNGRPLASGRPERVSPGDVLLFGAVSCKLLTSGQLYDLLM